MSVIPFSAYQPAVILTQSPDEAKCQVFVRAATPIEGLFFPDAANKADDQDSLAAEALSESLQLPSLPNVSLYNPSEREKREKEELREGKKAGAFGVLGIWTGEDERFAYVRHLWLLPAPTHILRIIYVKEEVFHPVAACDA